MSETFVNEVLEGTALWTDIDDWIDQWHAAQPEMELHDFLGMSWNEYRLWAEQPAALRLILAAREQGEPVEQLLAQRPEAIAARGLSQSDARIVREWLKETGRL